MSTLQMIQHISTLKLSNEQTKILTTTNMKCRKVELAIQINHKTCKIEHTVCIIVSNKSTIAATVPVPLQ